ncbi:hypothetical protein ACFSQQ_09580 [Mesorhizobium kowhaii]|uniref:hypothetical protein n=1 Tax=Mesorhizobium kowhaii TaxID=1300272 RepID=UPI0035EC0D00
MSWACSLRQRPGGERTGLRFSHSAMQQANARASADARGSPPSNSAMPARSSKNANQSSPDQPSLPVRSNATTPAL